MGKISLAAKITHVPSMFLSETPGPHFGCRQAAIDGLKEIGRRCEAAGVDTIVVFDTHWLVNTAYHINAQDHYKASIPATSFRISSKTSNTSTTDARNSGTRSHALQARWVCV